MTGVRWGIFGTGGVAHKFAEALRRTPGAELTFVASRSPERARQFAAAHGVAAVVEGYEMAASPPADVVYIATPPSAHRDHALACIAAGKGVLIEKPFAASAVEAAAIIEAARAAGVFCMEAVWTRFLPALAVARSALAEGAIGEPRALTASFANPMAVDPTASLFNPALGGGALAHRGVYPISLALDLLGEAVVCGGALNPGATGVDEEVSAILRHASGAQSSIYASLRTSAANDLAIFGTGGRLRFLGSIFRPHAIEISRTTPGRAESGDWSKSSALKEGALAHDLRRRLDAPLKLIRRRSAKVLHAPYIASGYDHQARAVTAAVAQGALEHPLMPLAQTLSTARIIDQIRALK